MIHFVIYETVKEIHYFTNKAKRNAFIKKQNYFKMGGHFSNSFTKEKFKQAEASNSKKYKFIKH